MYRSSIEGLTHSTRAIVLASVATAIATTSCGPSNSSDAPVASVTSKVTTPATFPLKVSSNGRYLVDQNGVPFRIQGDTAWQASTDVTLSGLRTYLDDRKAKNFNTVVVQATNPVRYVAASPAPATKGANGALPFLQNASGGTWDGDPGFAGNLVGASGPFHFDANFATPNDTYFAWIDTLVSEAAARGILIIMAPCYLGYANGATDGWWQTLTNSVNTQSVSYGFGRYLGNRYKSFPNILWQGGVDMVPAAGSEGEARALKILQGIQSAGASQLWTAEWSHDYLSTDEPAFAPYMGIQSIYTHGSYPALGPTYGRARAGYARTPAMPTFLTETTYEASHDATATQIREFMWGGALSAIGGAVLGSTLISSFDTNWQANLNSPSTLDMQRLGALLDSIPWYQLVPSGLSGMKTLITAGTGTYTSMGGPGSPESGGDDWVVSAATPDGKYLVAYVPDPHSGSITVDMTALSGSVRARWYDPTNGSYSTIGTFAASGKRAFSTPGVNSGAANDWVLIMDPASAMNPPPTVATAASASPSPVTGTSTTLNVLGADDGGESTLTYTWSTTGTPPAPVSFATNGSNSAKQTAATFSKAGSYAFQVVIKDQNNQTVTSNVNVAVSQTATAVAVSPGSASVPTGGMQQFMAVAQDQFGAPLGSQPPISWTASAGTVSSSGLFAAGTTAGTCTVSAACSGLTGRATVTVTTSGGSSGGGSGTVSLAPTADAFVRDGTYASNNYGTAADLETKTANASWQRVSFLKFDLGSVTGSITGASLRLGTSATIAEPVVVNAFGVSDTSWTESGITWNNQPALTTSALASVTVNPAQGYSWDVTSYIQAQKNAGQQVVTLALQDPNVSTADVEFGSRESSIVPALVITANTPTAPAPVTLSPTADAYVRAGTYAGNNYGSDPSLNSKVAPSTPDYTRWSYLKFDLSSISGSVGSARLQLFGSIASAEQITVQVYAVSDTTWNESTIIWNNRPAQNGNALGSIVMTSSTPVWYEWDVTSYLRSEKSAGRNVVTLVLINPNESTNVCTFNSREASSNAARLVVTPG